MTKQPRPSAYAPYDDPESYILEWTERIWRDGGLALIREMYAPDLSVHGAYGTSLGVESVVRGSLAKHSVFPDRPATTEDVVWEARGDHGFVSYHRALHVGPHAGPWVYGPASYRTSVNRGIAVCLVHDARVVEEWVVRDEWAVVEQLGFDAEDVAARMVDPNGPALPGAGSPHDVWQAPNDVVVAGVSGPRPDHHGTEVALVVRMIEEVWNERHFELVRDLCHRDLLCHTAGRRVAARASGYQRESWRLLGAVPDGRYTLLDLAAGDRGTGVRVAALWSLTGTYAGAPLFGPPTGSPVAVLGVSMFDLRDDRILREYRVYDELALLVQIVRARTSAEADR
jgi:predicted ester cyclase